MVVYKLLCFAAARPQSAEEKAAAMKHLGHLLHLRRAPRRHECELALLNEPALASR